MCAVFGFELAIVMDAQKLHNVCVEFLAQIICLQYVLYRLRDHLHSLFIRLWGLNNVRLQHVL